MARSLKLSDSASNGTGVTLSWPGGEGVLQAEGTWDGADVTLQFAPTAPTSADTPTPLATDVVLSEAEPLLGFHPIPEGSVRAVIANGGGSESLTVYISRIR